MEEGCKNTKRLSRFLLCGMTIRAFGEMEFLCPLVRFRPSHKRTVGNRVVEDRSHFNFPFHKAHRRSSKAQKTTEMDEVGSFFPVKFVMACKLFSESAYGSLHLPTKFLLPHNHAKPIPLPSGLFSRILSLLRPTLLFLSGPFEQCLRPRCLML